MAIDAVLGYKISGCRDRKFFGRQRICWLCIPIRPRKQKQTEDYDEENANHPDAPIMCEMRQDTDVTWAPDSRNLLRGKRFAGLETQRAATMICLASNLGTERGLNFQEHG